MQALFRRIERLAPTEATVLIRGERGTGKELVAAAIRGRSRRRERAYVKVNCAALPGDLLASELFGHERGAFTGAHERQEGLVAAAHGGTLFLDEIGDLSPSGQAMLLRFLQEREVRPIGSRRTHQVDVRVIAATNKDLESAMARGEFREDLYDRLREVVVEVPPLRERREDIPLLIEHFLEAASVRHGLPKPRLGPDARRSLLRYGWPGNVRELEQTLSGAVVFSSEGLVQPWQLWPSSEPCSPGREPARPAVVRSAHAEPTLAVPAVGDFDLVSNRQRLVLELAARRGVVRRLDLVRRFGVSRETARQELALLVAAGLLQRAGAGRGARYVPPSLGRACQEAEKNGGGHGEIGRAGASEQRNC